MKKANVADQTKPITVDEHRTQGKANEVKNVNEALNFLNGDDFEKDLTEILNGDYEEKGQTVVVALIDLDNFGHINKDFGILLNPQMEMKKWT